MNLSEKDFQANLTDNFWQSEVKRKPCTPSFIYGGNLSQECEDGALTSNYYLLTATSLLQCNRSPSVKVLKRSVITWKCLEPFASGRKKGFKLIYSGGEESFLADNECEQVNWLHFLAKTCIMTNIQSSYLLSDLLGSGAFSEVRLATHKRCHQTVAIKLVAKSSTGYAPSLKEIQLMRRLSHPSILKLLEVYDCPDHIALVLECAAGGTLFDYVVMQKRVEESLVKSFMIDLLNAVVFCHKNLCVHRDLKLDNILLANPDDLLSFKIADFGLACDLESEKLGRRCGSVGYIAPEIILDRLQSNKVDVFSIGVIAHILLSGTAPFKDSTELGTLRANRDCKIDLNSPFWAHISDIGKDFVAKLMSKEPMIRPTAQEALNHPWLRKSLLIPSTPSLVDINESPIKHSNAVLSDKLDEVAAKKEKTVIRGFLTALSRQGPAISPNSPRSPATPSINVNHHRRNSAVTSSEGSSPYKGSVRVIGKRNMQFGECAAACVEEEVTDTVKRHRYIKQSKRVIR
mmetsp:Transcript_26823/g.48338  ORF Transcript_26823/g.48338 Transcript_26823/m.48338 type:complete len:517 (+) Transcript_26823:88-1638(+)